MGEWHGQPAQGRRNNGRALNVIAIVLAVAALVVGVIALTRAARTAPPASPAPAPTSAPPSAAAQNTTDAHRALCQPISPLMADVDRISNTYMGLSPAGSPQRGTLRYLNSSAIFKIGVSFAS